MSSIIYHILKLQGLMPQVFKSLRCLTQYLPLVAVTKLRYLLFRLSNYFLNHFVHIRYRFS